MSDRGPMPASAMRNHGSGAGGWTRIVRLARKELREILRDRRTIVTLVLMPVLLYPLLSLGCRQFLLAQKLADGQVQAYYLGFRSVEQFDAFSAYLAIAPADPSAPHLEAELYPDLEQALREQKIDLGVRLAPTASAESGGPRGPPTVELLASEGSLLSEQAREYLEQRITAAGIAYLQQALRQAAPGFDASIWRARRVEVPAAGGPAFSLVSLVPLVLILMTITGAVYPAIDLTAGERERGTLEILVAAPVPRLALLLAKYVAVFVVAALTATVNLAMMTATVVLSGLGSAVFPSGSFGPLNVLAVFGLLLLFASFFSAVLLAIASFARSFKEAQAYLVPLMLASIAPGMLVLLPGVQLGGPLAVLPLVNVVLLARQLFEGTATASLALIVVASTLLYALAAIALAARLFGAEAVLYSEQSGWAQVVSRPRKARAAPSVSLALFCLALIFPLHFATLGVLAQQTEAGLSARLLSGAAATVCLFLLWPTFAAWLRRVPLRAAFQLDLPLFLGWLGAVLLGISLWPLAHEVVVLQTQAGIFPVPAALLEQAQRVKDQLPAMPWPVLFATIALVPAVCEEWFFRGLLQRALLTRLRPAQAILLAAVLFGLFHVVAQGLLWFPKLLPSTLLGLVLGWVCYRTQSLWPAILVHLTHNGLLAWFAHAQPRWLGGDTLLAEPTQSIAHLPAPWLLSAVPVAALGAVLIWLAGRKR